MIPFSKPFRAPREGEYVSEALGAGGVTGDGPFTGRASGLLSRRLNGARAMLTTSCTHALELSALLLDVGPEDEVVCPSLTFTSTANAFALRGARIRFADADPGTFSMGLRELAAAVTPRTTVAVAMPYGGVARDPDTLEVFCRTRGISLVVDNAHGLFGSFRGRPLGTFGRLSALSFHGTKNVSCGEGGALVLNDVALLARAEILREKGTDRARFYRGEVDKYTWRDIGSSYLPSDVLAAVLCAQLEAADDIQARRQAVWSAYRAVLEPAAEDLGIVLQEIPEGMAHPAHLFSLLLPEGSDRAAVLSRIRKAGFLAVTHYEPLHLAPARLRCLPDGLSGPEPLPETEKIARRLIRLPLFADLSADDASGIASTLVGILREAR